MSEPPSEMGADQEAVTPRLTPVTCNEVGAPGVTTVVSTVSVLAADGSRPYSEIEVTLTV